MSGTKLTCENCGHSLWDEETVGAEFCVKCGSNLWSHDTTKSGNSEQTIRDLKRKIQELKDKLFSVMSNTHYR